MSIHRQVVLQRNQQVDGEWGQVEKKKCLHLLCWLHPPFSGFSGCCTKDYGQTLQTTAACSVSEFDLPRRQWENDNILSSVRAGSCWHSRMICWVGSRGVLSGWLAPVEELILAWSPSQGAWKLWVWEGLRVCVSVCVHALKTSNWAKVTIHIPSLKHGITLLYLFNHKVELRGGRSAGSRSVYPRSTFLFQMFLLMICLILVFVETQES